MNKYAAAIAAAAAVVASAALLWPSDPGPCACSPGEGCEYQVSDPFAGTKTWLPAPKGLTLQPGEFRGDSCLLKTCTEHVSPGCVGSFPACCPALGCSMPDACKVAP